MQSTIVAMLVLIAQAGTPGPATRDDDSASTNAPTTAHPGCAAPSEQPGTVQGVIVLPPAIHASPGGGPLIVEVHPSSEPADIEAAGTIDPSTEASGQGRVAQERDQGRSGSSGEAPEASSTGAEGLTQLSAPPRSGVALEVRDAAGRIVEVIRDDSGGFIEIVREPDGSLVSARGIERSE
jgi:hypothetical protein